MATDPKTLRKSTVRKTARNTAPTGGARRHTPLSGAASSAVQKAGARSAKAAARREAILDAALDEFSARGFAAARLDDVAQRAGVAKGTIYLYFADKESLFQELIRTRMNPVVGSIEAAFAADLPPRLVADRMIDIILGELFSTQRKQIIRLMISEGPRFPAIAEFYYREVLSRVMTAARQLLRRAHERGEIADDALIRFPQLLAAPAILGLIWGGLFERFEPLDVRAMMRLHFDSLFAPRRPA